MMVAGTENDTVMADVTAEGKSELKKPEEMTSADYYFDRCIDQYQLICEII